VETASGREATSWTSIAPVLAENPGVLGCLRRILAGFFATTVAPVVVVPIDASDLEVCTLRARSLGS